MSRNDVDNHDDNILPFADSELATDVHFDHLTIRKGKSYRKSKSKTKPTQKQSSHNKPNFANTLSFLYFDNSVEEDNILSFLSYTGPSNTLHLQRSLYLPQILSTNEKSTTAHERFIHDYDQTIASFTPTSPTISLSIYIRFGISYIIPVHSVLDRVISLREFFGLRNRGKEIRSAFYTCKGVTSPKHLLNTITQLNYIQTTSNEYFYDVQLHDMRKKENCVLHFRYDEQLRCTNVSVRTSFPINFDFIRDKTVSRFRSIDDSYSDIFDFRIQLAQQQWFDPADPEVLEMLRDVPINEVLSLDPSTRVLHVAANLQKYVKYLKCTRSSSYRNADEQIIIRIGTYEEYQMNSNGQCEPLMKASNTMTVEYRDCQTRIPSAEKLYTIGMWFSNLCQTCVDLPTMMNREKRKTTKWFCDVPGRKSQKSIKQINVNELTVYRTKKSNKSYTNEELRLVKKILREENLRNLFFDSNEEKDLEQIYQSLTKRLKTSGAPSADEALQKIERAYQTICKESI